MTDPGPPMPVSRHGRALSRQSVSRLPVAMFGTRPGHDRGQGGDRIRMASASALRRAHGRLLGTLS